MNEEERAQAILDDLEQWLQQDDGSHLCSHYALPIKSVLIGDLTHPDIYMRHNPGISYLEADIYGKVKWFVINPTLSEEDRESEAKLMIVWLYEKNLAKIYHGTVGNTEFSRWLWQDQLQGEWIKINDKFASVKVTRQRGGEWANASLAI